MSDLIRRQDAIEAIRKSVSKSETEDSLCFNLGLGVAEKEVESLPSADAVEVVRCKDCLMTKERDEYTNMVRCCRHREYMDDMYYCADGLLREDGEA